MPATIQLVGLCAGALLATGCVLVNVDTVERMPTQGTPLSAALHRAYLDLASAQHDDGDGLAASLFAYKARAAAQGEFVAPEDLDDWTLSEENVGHFVVARSRLVTALVRARRVNAAEETARAQTMFDCWIEAEEDGEDVSVCRTGFKTALSELRAAVSSRE